MPRLLLSLILCGLLTPVVSAEESQAATVLQQTTLYAEPYSDAAALATLQPRQQVAVLERKGGWYRVRSSTQSGWLHMSHIRFGDGSVTQGDSGGLGQTLQFLSTGRSGASGVTVATGIRGLDAADMSNAKPNHQAVKRLDRYQVTPRQAKNFAARAQLQSQPLGYIDSK